MRALVEQCTARAKRTGQRCRIRVLGGGVCRVHGGAAPQVKAKRLERITMAEALAADQRRPPHEVLASVLHQSEFLLRRMQDEIPDRIEAKTLERLVTRLEQAGRWASKALEAGVSERSTRLAEKQGALVGEVIQRILEALVLSDAQWAKVGTVVPAELRRLTAIGS